MPRKRRRERGRHGQLDGDQEMELMLGPGHRTSEFVDDEARAEAWYEHRERLLAEEHPGDRPWAWWRFESGLPVGEVPSGSQWDPETYVFRAGGDRAAWLREQGLLTPFEEAGLAEQERRYRELASDREFAGGAS